MTTYSTYQEAKIAMPEACIVHNFVDGNFFGMPTREGIVLNSGYCRFANPADYCVTVEKFLADGNKGAAGDWFVIGDGFAERLWSAGVDSFNTPSSQDCNIFILRAAALDEKEESRTNLKLHYTIDKQLLQIEKDKTEDDYDKGMREAMKRIAILCGRKFAVDISYEELPELVEKLIQQAQKPFLQTSEDYEHTKTLNFIRYRLVEVRGEPKNLDYMHKLNSAIMFVESVESAKAAMGGNESMCMTVDIESKPKRTKVELVKVELSPKEIFSEMLNGGVFFVNGDKIYFDGEQFWRG